MSLVKTSPIIAIATGNGNAGVGIVRISGGEDDVKALFQKMFPGKEIKPRYAELLPIRDTQGQILDTGIVLYFRAPFLIPENLFLNCRFTAAEFFSTGLSRKC